MLKGFSIALHRPSAARDRILNIDPELVYFLSLLAGIAALLVSLYGFSGPRRNKAKPLARISHTAN